MKSIVVGTAGHIDHGKSSLVEALTGTHPDRLEEERRRGITIDLGFAFLEENGVHFGFVDVPGHERFVKNMLAGASGIDVVLLVIAADEGVKPQTREHFEISQLLGVDQGIVAITKSDRVDAEAMELAKLEVQEFVAGTFLEKAPLIAVSAKTGAGLAELKSSLHQAARAVRAMASARYARLPIDRSFSIKGFGTVVTGTLLSGELRVEEEAERLPGGERLRIRGLQTAGKAVEVAKAGRRTAINLAGIEHDRLHRGMVLATPGKFRSSRRADVLLRLLKSAPKLKQGARVHFYAGTSETVGEVYLYEQAELNPGEEALAHLKLQDEVVVVRGDRFIVRQLSPITTIGGGVVVDPLARRPKRSDAQRPAFLRTLQQGAPAEILSAMVERSLFGLGMAEIVARTGWTEPDIEGYAAWLTEEGKAQRVASEPLLLVSQRLFQEARERILSRVEQFHKTNPLLPGISREEVRAGLGRRVRLETFQTAIQALISDKKVSVAGDLLRKPGAEITLTPEEQKSRRLIEEAFAVAGLAVPSVKEVLDTLPVDRSRAEKLLQILLREKVLVRVSTDLIFHKSALQKLSALLSKYKSENGTSLGVPAFKTITGISRKYAIPLLEYLDQQRVTRRVGDQRVIL